MTRIAPACSTRCARPRPPISRPTLREVAAFGYEGVELFDLHGHEPATVAAGSSELGLVACARHARLEAIESELPALAAEARGSAGSGSCVELGRPAELDRRRSRASPPRPRRPRRSGLELGYHNHDAEVEQGFLDRLPADVFLELDAGWAWYAGADPVDAARARPARPHQGLPRPRRALVLPGGRRRGRLRAHRARRGARRGGVADRRAGRAGGLGARGRAPLARGASSRMLGEVA